MPATDRPLDIHKPCARPIAFEAGHVYFPDLTSEPFSRTTSAGPSTLPCAERSSNLWTGRPDARSTMTRLSTSGSEA